MLFSCFSTFIVSWSVLISTKLTFFILFSQTIQKLFETTYLQSETDVKGSSSLLTPLERHKKIYVYNQVQDTKTVQLVLPGISSQSFMICLFAAILPHMNLCLVVQQYKNVLLECSPTSNPTQKT